MKRMRKKKSVDDSNDEEDDKEKHEKYKLWCIKLLFLFMFSSIWLSLYLNHSKVYWERKLTYNLFLLAMVFSPFLDSRDLCSWSKLLDCYTIISHFNELYQKTLTKSCYHVLLHSHSNSSSFEYLISLLSSDFFKSYFK